MEDLVVTSSRRSQGIATDLWRKLAEKCRNSAVSGCDWNVLSWNSSARKFYEGKSAENLSQSQNLHLFRIEGQNLRELAKRGVDFHVEIANEDDWKKVSALIRDNYSNLAKDFEEISNYTKCLVIKEEGEMKGFCIYHNSYSWDGR